MTSKITVFVFIASFACALTATQARANSCTDEARKLGPKRLSEVQDESIRHADRQLQLMARTLGTSDDSLAALFSVAKSNKIKLEDVKAQYDKVRKVHLNSVYESVTAYVTAGILAADQNGKNISSVEALTLFNRLKAAINTPQFSFDDQDLGIIEYGILASQTDVKVAIALFKQVRAKTLKHAGLLVEDAAWITVAAMISKQMPDEIIRIALQISRLDDQDAAGILAAIAVTTNTDYKDVLALRRQVGYKAVAVTDTAKSAIAGALIGFGSANR